MTSTKIPVSHLKIRLGNRIEMVNYIHSDFWCELETQDTTGK